MKMAPAKNIDDHIALFPASTQVLLKQIKATVKKAAPDAEEAISYGIPTFKLNGNLVHFAGYKNHIGFYPGAAGIEAFKKELSVYKGAKGSVQFPLGKPLPLTLITRIVKFRVKQNLEKANIKKTVAAGPVKKDKVMAYMRKLKHPLKVEMETVRKIIKGVDKKISERIKWKAPSYHYNGTDMVTFNAWAEKNIHLVFHHPAIVKIKSSLLQGDYKDRRMMYFNSMKEVRAGKKELQRIMKELIEKIRK